MGACPSCGKELPGEFPFCPFCGASLAPAVPAAGAEERKVVSVLFADLVGFTAASETADPEDVRARLRPYHETVRSVLERHGGSVEKFVGDAVMAVFGAPVAHEDDAERAVRAGLRIVEAIGDLNAADPALRLQVRVGVNTGEAVVSLRARPELGEALVAGDVVNTAARLQSAAPVDGVAISDPTYLATERVFDFDELEPVLVKGKAQPLRLWRPLQPRARFGADVTRSFATSLVGRELERTLLVSALERSAAQRLCQLVTLVGEPGVGKSRLVAELFAYVDERPGLVRWRQGRCLPYGEGISFWALGEIVKAQAGILDSDDPAQTTLKLERALPEDPEERAWLLGRLAPLVGLPGEPAAREESFTAWRRFVELLAAEGPAVVVFEDLHWADLALLAFLEHVAEWAQDVPLLVVCTARPELYERAPTFGAQARNVSRVNLAPLTDSETRALISALLERVALPESLERTLLEQAGGNPLYAEEFVRLLGDRELLASPDEMELPRSLQALIAARLDTLGAERKSLLQDAAVLGKVFRAGALAAMGDRELAEVEQVLHELVRRELVRPSRTSTMQRDREYSFWHALVGDVCYRQIPRTARAERHERAAAWIEQEAGERSDDLADVLAHHYLEALQLREAAGGDPEVTGLRERAVRYLALAGERALPLDVASAEQALAQALELAGDGDPVRPRLLELSAQAAQLLGRLREAREAVEQAIGLHRVAGDRMAEARALIDLSNTLQRQGDAAATNAIEDTLRLLEAEPPSRELVDAYVRRASDRSTHSAYPEAIAAAERALSLARQLGLDEPSGAHGSHGLARAQLGDRRGIDDLRRAIGLAVERGETRRAAAFHNNLCLLVWQYEGPAAALETSNQGIAFCKERGIVGYVDAITCLKTTFLAEAGRVGEALELAGPLAARLEAAGDYAQVEPRSVDLRLRARCGESRPELLEVSELMVARARDTGEPQNPAIALPAAAELQLAHGRAAEAGALLEELAGLTAARPDFYYAAHLPAALRVARGLGDVELVRRLTDGVPAVAPLRQHALRHAAAQQSELEGRHREAAELYSDAAARWRAFSNVSELAYALHGQGRCLHTLGEPSASEPLREARELFAALGYVAAVAEVDAVSADTVGVLEAESGPAGVRSSAP